MLRRAKNGWMRWEEFERVAPKLAKLGRLKLGEPGVVLTRMLTR